MDNILRSFVRQILPYLRLYRIFETSMIAGTVIMALIMMGLTSLLDFSLIAITVWFVGAGIACWNDVLDINEDRISHPERPIPKNDISLVQAKILGTINLIITFIVSLFISIGATILILFTAAVGIGYSFTTKKILLLKNLTVIFSAIAVLFILPKIYDFEINSLYSIFVFSISLLLFSYEILKDIHDLEGDKVVGIKTLVMITSSSTIAKISTVLFMISCLVMAISFFSKQYWIESSISFITAFLILIPGLNLVRNPSQQNSERMRYAIVSIILVSLTIVGSLLLNRNLNA